jgi:ATP-dependent helicase YprA (DUF1998 family)
MRSDGYQVRLVMHSTETFAVTNLFRRGADAAVVTAIVFGYFKVDKKNNIIDAIDVDNPPVIMNTKGMWLDVPAKAVEILERK